nr:integrase, catalytic region, zinc finger, CCHC-type, peptidase aspartic, catalytic [Tanacetum cinerariifolium]
MLDWTVFASWQQRIRLYCRGKKNRVNILKSIDEGPYQMGQFGNPLLKAQKEQPIWVQNEHEFTLTCLLKKKIGGQDNAFDDDVDEQPVQDLALNVDNVFQADDCDAFDSDVNEAPTTQTMFMANLSSADPVTDEA